jgi:DNA polymerase I-like protein with 3'-5' exonuclease and polymerase domains
LARGLLMQQRRQFAQFYRWSDALACMAHQGKQLTTRLGWTLRFRPGSDVEAPERTGRNFPMQSHGAEIMRLVMIRATEAGLRVGGALHDGFTMEAASSEIEARAEAMRAIMERSALDVIGGVIPVNVEIARWPDRYPVEDKHRELFERLVQMAKEAAR